MTRKLTALLALGMLAPAATAQAQAPPGNSDQTNYQEVVVGGTVPGVLSLLLGDAATFGNFIPGTEADYFATTSGSVTSTAGDAVLSVADPSTYATGHLVNGSYSLVDPLRAAAASSAGFGRPLTPVRGSASPLPVLVWIAPVANDPLTITFAQRIAATDSLRTGNYGKTLIFTLSTSNP